MQILKLTVRNFMRCVSADVFISGVTLVAGFNESGKTSIARALSCLVLGDVKPHDDCLKKDIKEVVLHGTQEAIIRLKAPDGMAEIVYPQPSERVADGIVPTATKQALGLSNFFDVPVKDRSAYIMDVLEIKPTQQELNTALDAIGCTEAEKLSAWTNVSAIGWDGAMEKVKKNGAFKKGAWEQITGTSYGAVIATGWRPEHWDEELRDYTQETLESAVDAAQAELENMLKIDAVSEVEKLHLENKACGLDQHMLAMATAQDAVKVNENRISNVKDELNICAVPTDVEVTHPCPACKAQLVVKNGVPSLPDTQKKSKAELKKALDHIDKLTAALKDYTAQRDKAASEAAQAQVLANESRACKARLEKLGNNNTPLPNIDGARRKVELAQFRLNAFVKYFAAYEINAEVRRLVDIYNILAPNGLRKTKLEDTLKSLNTRLAQLATVASWKHVKIDADMKITYGAFKQWKLSESAKFRARVLLQCAFVQFDNSQLMCIDGADILDSSDQGRNGLMALLKYMAMPTLLCMTISKNRDRLPDLRAAGMGQTYLIENGTAQEYTTKAPAVAA